MIKKEKKKKKQVMFIANPSFKLQIKTNRNKIFKKIQNLLSLPASSLSRMFSCQHIQVKYYPLNTSLFQTTF